MHLTPFLPPSADLIGPSFPTARVHMNVNNGFVLWKRTVLSAARRYCSINKQKNRQQRVRYKRLPTPCYLQSATLSITIG
ncbi:hypothetical protein KC343_g68 [Hortaea werneckii]|nr:hypothetical protein KC317_g67 [Hortaea werneckii]KAI7628709.1 hypothetical protein KC346_g71 [Hortaea werneckii]KAI7638470.1 hypothetical protein KC343_g68 [Hortaea werneckii]